MSAFDIYCQLDGMLSGSVFCDEPMARYTSFRIGGPAALFIECATVSDITRTLEVVRQNDMPWMVVGKGSNLLVSDDGFNGAVISLGSEFKKFAFPDREQDENLLVAGAGAILSNLVQAAFKNGYSGFEFAVGIPGTLGGALFMNAGSANEWIGSIVDWVTVFSPESGLKRYRGEELDWGYRHSGIRHDEIVLECGLRITPGHTGQIRARMEASLKRRRKTQPLTLPSAGSVFRNPEGDSAGRIIEELGFKGYKVGGAEVSSLHANFIVNTGNAKAWDVVEIITQIRKRVKEEYDRELQPEIRFVGFPL